MSDRVLQDVAPPLDESALRMLLDRLRLLRS
jgi:hypothetical protein